MKLATLACLAALCLIGPGARAAPGEPAPARITQLVAQPAAPQAGPEPVAAPAAQAVPQAAPQASPQAAPQASPQAAPHAAPRPASTARAERRRRSYAACNRASHQRGLYGGRRRRFLIRCRLGYERTRGQPGAVPSPQTGRKP